MSIDATEVIPAIRRKEKDALGSLYDEYSDIVYTILLHSLKNENLAKEGLLKTFQKAWSTALQYDLKTDDLFTWLMTHTRATAKEIYLQHDGTIPQDTSHDLTRVKLPSSTIDSNFQEALDCVLISGESVDDTAKRFNLPLGTLKTRIRFGVNNLRKNLNPESGSFSGISAIALLIICLS